MQQQEPSQWMPGLFDASNHIIEKTYWSFIGPIEGDLRNEFKIFDDSL